MKLFKHLVMGFLATFFANSTHASPTYLIDPTQSYISAYAPTWTAYSYMPYFVTGPGSPPPAPTVVWDVTWAIKNFQLSGNFQGSTEISPWAPAWAHLTISDQRLHNQLPGYISNAGSILPKQITYSVLGGLVADTGPCLMADPFYPSLGGSCFYEGSIPYISGTFDGQTLAVSVATDPRFSLPVTFLGGLGTYKQIADPGPPPLLDPSLYPTTWLSYQIVAAAVPEPGTLLLVLIGSLAFIRRTAKNRISVSSPLY